MSPGRPVILVLELWHSFLQPCGGKRKELILRIAQSDSEVLKAVDKVTFASLLSDLGQDTKSHFESLWVTLSHFESLWVTLSHFLFGKPKQGLTNGALSPNFSEKIGGQSVQEKQTFLRLIWTFSVKATEKSQNSPERALSPVCKTPFRFPRFLVSFPKLRLNNEPTLEQAFVNFTNLWLAILSWFSGKKKAHKHKSFWPVTPPVTGGSPDREARGQSFTCYPRSPRNINLFVRIPDREDRWPGPPEKVLCAKVLCAFSAP